MNNKFVFLILGFLCCVFTLVSDIKSQSDIKTDENACNLLFDDEEYLQTELNRAVYNNNAGCVKQILTKGIDPNYERRNMIGHIGIAIKGTAPILIAAEFSSIEITKMLLSAGVNVKNEYAVGALFIASDKGDLGLVEVLLNAGVNPNDKGYFSENSLIVASINGNEKVVEILLKHSANVNTVNSIGITSLMGTDNVTILNLLLKAGASTEIKDKNGRTAIFYAVKNTQIDKLKVLLQSGAKTNLKDEKGVNPLMLAEQIADKKLRDKIVKILKESDVRR